MVMAMIQGGEWAGNGDRDGFGVGSGPCIWRIIIITGYLTAIEPIETCSIGICLPQPSHNKTQILSTWEKKI